MTTPSRSTAHDALWTAGSFFCLAFVAIHIASGPQAITNVWFANAAAIAILATAARARWPLLLLAVAFANLAANWVLRGNLLLSASFVPGNLIEIAIGAWLLQQFDLVREFDASPARLARVLFAAGMLPQVAGATIGAATLQWHGFATFQGAWLGWYVDSTLGALALLPLALALRRAPRGTALQQLATPASLLLLVLTTAVIFAAFWMLPNPFAVVSLPLVASVFFVAPVTTFGLSFALVLLVCAGLDYGWFQVGSGAASFSNLLLYLPAAAAVLPAQLMAPVVARMRQLQSDTHALTDVGNDSIVVLDRQGLVRGVNRAFERTFGSTSSALIGQAIDDAVRAPNPQQLRSNLHKALGGESVQVRVERETALGRRVLDVQFEPVHGADGTIDRVLLSAHDVSDLVDVQRELERTVQRLHQTNEGLQQFVRIASHDMREPLNTINQFSDLIRTDHAADLTPTARLYFEHIGTGALRMRRLLDDVLSFARLEGVTEVVRQPVPLAGVIDAVTAALGARIAGHGAFIERAKNLPVVHGHESLLVLVMQNLISNAIKFVAPGQVPQVRISSRDDGEHVVVTVADNGIGIAASDQGKMFVPFTRLHTRRRYDGTGLGLAICKRSVQAMGGSIEIESAPGEGTRMHVRLRRAVPD